MKSGGQVDSRRDRLVQVKMLVSPVRGFLSVITPASVARLAIISGTLQQLDKTGADSLVVSLFTNNKTAMRSLDLCDKGGIEGTWVDH